MSRRPINPRYILKDGDVFGRLTIKGDVSGSGNKAICVCACGTEKPVQIYYLVTDQIISCGCARSEQMSAMSKTHGMRRTPEYSTWCAMKARCFNPKSAHYSYYGGRGISICDEWKYSFETFFAYVGQKPTPRHSIDRFPDSNGNYEPGNVRWATVAEQSVNKRQRHTPLTQEQKDFISRLHKGVKKSAETRQRMSEARTDLVISTSRVVEYNGKSQCVATWARERGMTYGKLISRIYNGWTIGQALGFESRPSMAANQFGPARARREVIAS